MDVSEGLERLLWHWGRVFGRAGASSEWDEDKSLTGEPMALALSGLRTGAVASVGEPSLGERVVRVRRAGRMVLLTVNQRYSARGRETRQFWQTRTWHPSLDAEAVEVAALELYRLHRMRSVVLRCAYCLERAPLRAKVVYAAQRLEVPGFSVRRYRAELRYARAWMAQRLFGLHAEITNGAGRRRKYPVKPRNSQ